MQSVRKPTWQQATALVSLSTCGAMTGFAFAHGTVDDMTSPTRMPVHLLALDKPAKPAATGDDPLRSAIVKVATNYLRMAQTRTPAEMEAMIWGTDSVDGVDHGESCAAFASLTLALGAQAAGQQSWVTGGSTYPWPLHQWADVRVDPNQGSPGIMSVLQDAQTHNRWHPLGDGYVPQPGDWVLFDGHVEVVTSYSNGVLSTIGGDSGPNLSVNAHTYPSPLAAQGIQGFVDNGQLTSAVGPAQPAATAPSAPAAGGSAAGGAAIGGAPTGAAAGQVEVMGILGQGQTSIATAGTGDASVPGTGTAATKGITRMVGTAGTGAMLATNSTVGTNSTVAMPGILAGAGMAAADGTTASGGITAGNGTTGGGITPGSGTRAALKAAGRPSRAATARTGKAGRAGSTARTKAGRASQAGQGPQAGAAAIPGLQLADNPPAGPTGSTSPSYTRNNPPATATHVPGTASQQAFISQIAPGAIAAQSRYGIPAAVTIAQAIDESGWGQSALAINDNNLFGIKGAGPAGSDMLPTQEFQNGEWVTISAPFRVYHNAAESIADHSQLLANGQAYQQAMADRHIPDAFANDLTGVYATDPQYGTNLIAIMRLYNLYQFDTAQTPTAPQAATAAPSASATASPNGAGRPSAAASPNGAYGVSGRISANGSVGQGGGNRGGGAATIPGVLDAYSASPARPVTPVTRAPQRPKVAHAAPRPAPRMAPRTSARITRYTLQIPRTVTTAFISTAKAPLSRAEPLYNDVADRTGIRWELLAACDWMQCQADPRLSPVYGEKIGTVNRDGTVYRSKSGALDQVANELIELALAVYWIDITARRRLSVRDLANVFAAFRWGGLLKLHDISAMEFPYSVEGLTAQHTKMRWPDVKDRNAPDKPGTRFRKPFGAVPITLCLGYPAIA
jgi:flagellum-specific peptidoglycan hydrolase FlgJ